MTQDGARDILEPQILQQLELIAICNMPNCFKL